MKFFGQYGGTFVHEDTSCCFVALFIGLGRLRVSKGLVALRVGDEDDLVKWLEDMADDALAEGFLCFHLES